MAGNMLHSKPMNHSPICSIIVAVFIWCELLDNKQGHNLLSADLTNVVSSVGLLSAGNPQQGYEPAIITANVLVVAIVISVHLAELCLKNCFQFDVSPLIPKIGLLGNFTLAPP